MKLPISQMIAEADLLAWHIEWRKRLLSAMRLWFKAETFKQGCDRLTDLRAVLNEQPQK